MLTSGRASSPAPMTTSLGGGLRRSTKVPCEDCFTALIISSADRFPLRKMICPDAESTARRIGSCTVGSQLMICAACPCNERSSALINASNSGVREGSSSRSTVPPQPDPNGIPPSSSVSVEYRLTTAPLRVNHLAFFISSASRQPPLIMPVCPSWLIISFRSRPSVGGALHSYQCGQDARSIGSCRELYNLSVVGHKRSLDQSFHGWVFAIAIADSSCISVTSVLECGPEPVAA